jgi:hypothetical protein
MAKKDWMAKLSALDGAINDRADVHATVLQTPSPSLNFIFGNGWGLPLGFSAILYGPPKSGKTVVGYSMVGQTHRDYEDGWVVRFDTEYRDHGQLSPQMAKLYGIDLNRYKAIESNHPKDIYDQIENQIGAMCADGMPLKLLIIDSMNGVQGRRAITNEGGVMTQQIGDVALTNKEGLKQVLAVQRKYNFSLLMTSHVAVEMDPIEQKRGNKFKMGASIGVQHHAEYFIFVEPNRNKDGKTNAIGQELVNASLLDMNGKADQVANKIRVTMKDSTMGPKGRHGQFTYSYQRGIFNTHEEIFLLGYRRGAIEKDGGHYFTIPGFTMPDKIKGEANFIQWFEKDAVAQEHVLRVLRKQDTDGIAASFDQQDAAFATPVIPDEEAEAAA